MNPATMRLTPLLFVILIWAGCSTPFQVSEVWSVPADWFSSDMLFHEGVVLLPVTAFHEDSQLLREPVGDEIDRQLNSRLPGTGVGWREFLELLDSIEGWGAYNRLLESFFREGIPDPEALAHLERGFDTRYVLYTEILPPVGTIRPRIVLLPVMEPVRIEVREDEKPLHEQISALCLRSAGQDRITLVGHLWDGVTGETVWRGNVTALVAANECIYDLDRDLSRIRKLVEPVVAKLFNVTIEPV